ncbi:pentapeptide repeat-containing protein [Paenarthrobacter nicotinovorans]|uniref:pentapeptide repeat-containing protein n=1 Tax=Paenarthrobacter TaxID=1742992 RepID=UPI003A803328
MTQNPVESAVLITVALTLFAFLWVRRETKKASSGKHKNNETLAVMIFVALLCSCLFLLFFRFAFNAVSFLDSTAPSPGSQTLPTGMPTSPSETSGVPSGASGGRASAITVAAGLFGGLVFVAFTVLRYRGHLQADERLQIERRASALSSVEHFSERFAKAADMLGSDKVATRMGGAYALAALTDEWAENRQQCIDLLCGYLRTPISYSLEASDQIRNVASPLGIPPSMKPGPDETSQAESKVVDSYRKRMHNLGREASKHARAEFAVRGAILSSISRGTSRQIDDPQSWSDCSFDLSGSYLPALDFSGSKFLETINFNTSIFCGTVNLRNAYFAKNAQFDGCLFTTHAWFAGASFAGNAWFRAADFQAEAAFGRTNFFKGIFFSHAVFSTPPHFRQNNLGGSEPVSNMSIANFSSTKFGDALTACPDSELSQLWEGFYYLQSQYRVICEESHHDSSLENLPGHILR